MTQGESKTIVDLRATDGIDDGANAYGPPPQEIAVGEFDELSINAASIGSHDVLHQSVELGTAPTWSGYLQNHRSRFRGVRRMPASSNGLWPSSLNMTDKGKGKAKGVVLRPQTVYHNVCSEQDPPCSVAVSPARQCVAFGCKGSVELFWVCRISDRTIGRDILTLDSD